MDIKKYCETLKYLKKSQIRYLIKNRLTRGKAAVTEAKAPVKGELHLWMPRLDEHPDYLKRFSLDELLAGNVTLLYESGTPSGNDWKHPEKSHLWNFNLQYLEFLIPLAAAYRESKDEKYYTCFRDYCERWISDNADGKGDGWHPYTISLRLTNLWICLDGFDGRVQEDQTFFLKLTDSMYAQYLHLQKKLELHLLGNHYLENLKTVMLGALYFKEPGIYAEYKSRFQEELKEQVLPDGVHYERSIMYHKIVLEDVMRAAKGVKDADQLLYQELTALLQPMTDAMYSLEEGMGHTPLFNDSGDNVARSMLSLLAALREEFSIAPVSRTAFPDAGYYCLRHQSMKILMDAGEIAPDYMPGHGHCDGLSFEMSVDQSSIFANSGTGQYQGNLRGYFRSTRAHNTVVIEGEEQSECWGEHRVARRISQVSGDCGADWIHGELVTATGRHQKRTILVDDQNVIVKDQVTGKAQAYLHLAPDYEYEEQDGQVLVKAEDGKVVCWIVPEPSDQIRVHRDGEICSYAPEFGNITNIQVLEIAWEGDGSEHEIQIDWKSSHKGEKS